MIRSIGLIRSMGFSGQTFTCDSPRTKASLRPASLPRFSPQQSKWEDGDVAWDIVRRGPEPLRSQV